MVTNCLLERERGRKWSAVLSKMESQSCKDDVPWNWEVSMEVSFK